tara:strand:+ start:198 stop:383 length:186 start_codon:yes stop_codon:yes gene_type:complete
MKNKRLDAWVRPNEYNNFKKGDDPHWAFIVISMFVALYFQLKWMEAQPSIFDAANNLTHTL